MISTCARTPGGSIREGIFQRPEEPKTQTAERRVHCAGATLSSSEFMNLRWIQEGEQMFSAFV